MSSTVDAGPLSVDSDGRFQMLLCEGVHYSAYALAGLPHNATFSAPIEFTANRQNSEIVLVLDKTFEEFFVLHQRKSRR